MKKVVPNFLVISSIVSIGALFLIFLTKNNDAKYLITYSKQLSGLSQSVYVMDEEEESSEIEEDSQNVVEEAVIQQTEEVVQNSESISNDVSTYSEVLMSYTGILTGYGPDCYGCGNYSTNTVSTSSGYHIANIVDGVIQPAFTITYDDYQYGTVRIVAGDKNLPYYSIVRITIPNQEPILAIVLDRGGTVGFDNCSSYSGCLTTFDLLYATESAAISKTYNVLFEVLRMGN